MSDKPKLSEIRAWTTGAPVDVMTLRSTVAALEAVLALHPKQNAVTSMVDGRVISSEDRCAHCYRTGVWPGPYPCLTVRTVTEHIDLED